MILPPITQTILPTPQQALSRAIQQMRYLQDPANSPEIQRRNRRRMRFCLPPLEEYYPMQHRLLSRGSGTQELSPANAGEAQALRAVETQQSNECPSPFNSQS